MLITVESGIFHTTEYLHAYAKVMGVSSSSALPCALRLSAPQNSARGFSFNVLGVNPGLKKWVGHFFCWLINQRSEKVVGRLSR